MIATCEVCGTRVHPMYRKPRFRSVLFLLWGMVTPGIGISLWLLWWAMTGLHAAPIWAILWSVVLLAYGAWWITLVFGTMAYVFWYAVLASEARCPVCNLPI